jgi:hypothetical protein
MMLSMIPLLRPYARVVNVARYPLVVAMEYQKSRILHSYLPNAMPGSMAGQSAVNSLSKPLQARITIREGATRDGIVEFMHEFVSDCARGDNVERGW